MNVRGTGKTPAHGGDGAALHRTGLGTGRGQFRGTGPFAVEVHERSEKTTSSAQTTSEKTPPRETDETNEPRETDEPSKPRSQDTRETYSLSGPRVARVRFGGANVREFAVAPEALAKHVGPLAMRPRLGEPVPNILRELEKLAWTEDEVQLIEALIASVEETRSLDVYQPRCSDPCSQRLALLARVVRLHLDEGPQADRSAPGSLSATPEGARAAVLIAAEVVEEKTSAQVAHELALFDSFYLFSSSDPRFDPMSAEASQSSEDWVG